MNSLAKLNILLIDDEPFEHTIFKRMFAKSSLNCEVACHAESSTAINFMKQKTQNDSLVPHPSIVVLDIHMPNVDGLQILRIMKQDEMLKKLPVFMFSTSKRASEVSDAYEFGATAFIEKGLDNEGVSNFVDLIKQFQLTARLPI